MKAHRLIFFYLIILAIFSLYCVDKPLLAIIFGVAAILLVAIESIIVNDSNQATTIDGKINLYDEVVLNSGGPRMLVISINGNNVVCTWVNNEGAFDHHEFKSVCVRKF
jgi:uncharacterized protein YodC (DUF2158 family)